MQACPSLALATILAALCSTAVHAAPASDPPPVHPTIVGGTDVPDGKYPFLVSLQRRGAGNPLNSHFCGGALISPSWVLTAAHCVRNQPGLYAVRMGQTRLDDGSGQSINVAEVHIHPRYPSSGKADVALLRLVEPVEDVKPVRLARSEGAGYEQGGRLLTVAGWGALRQGGRGPARMQEVEVPFITTAECQRQYAGRKTVHPQLEMCASRAGKDSCQGDSGGPLFVAAADGGWFQLGVVSWGVGCAREGSPGVYARLAAAEIDDFIHRVWDGR